MIDFHAHLLFSLLLLSSHPLPSPLLSSPPPPFMVTLMTYGSSGPGTEFELQLQPTLDSLTHREALGGQICTLTATRCHCSPILNPLHHSRDSSCCFLNMGRSTVYSRKDITNTVNKTIARTNLTKNKVFC